MHDETRYCQETMRNGRDQLEGEQGCQRDSLDDGGSEKTGDRATWDRSLFVGKRSGRIIRSRRESYASFTGIHGTGYRIRQEGIAHGQEYENKDCKLMLKTCAEH